MGDKISQLPAATTVDGTELVPIVQGGATKKVTGSILRSPTGSAGGDLTGSYPNPTLTAITTAQASVGSQSAIPVVSVDAKGRVVALSTVVNPALTTNQIAGLTTVPAAALATTGVAGLSTFAARADHQHARPTPAEIGALSTIQIAGLSTVAPVALATASVVGLSSFAARADHQHVFPTASQVGALGATAAAGGDLTGNYPSPTLAAITTAQANAGSATVIPVVSIDGKGRVTALTTVAFAALTTAQIAGLSTTAPAALATAPVVGLSTFAARADHQHVFPTAAQVGALGATAAAGGDLTGNFPNPTLAAITTAQSNIGSSTVVPVLSVDDKGRVTSLTTAPISGGGGGGNATQLQGVDISTTAPTNGQYLVYNNTSQKWEPFTPGYSASVLVAAGGGGGGSTATASRGSGGGAGGVISAALTLTPGVSYAITVGAGGPGALNATTLPSDANGANSVFSGAGITTQTAIGGGGAGQNGTDTPSLRSGESGGSGGGGGTSATGSGTFAGGAGTSGQGFAGGTGQHVSGSWATGGGGGGASGAGVSPTTASMAPNGGVGLGWFGTTYGGGGGGAGSNSLATGAGGAGGGGAGNRGGAGVAGTVNTGGGGGGGATGGNGGSGVVVVAYAGLQRGTGGTVTTANGFTFHTFTTSGTYTA